MPASQVVEHVVDRESAHGELERPVLGMDRQESGHFLPQREFVVFLAIYFHFDKLGASFRRINRHDVDLIFALAVPPSADMNP